MKKKILYLTLSVSGVLIAVGVLNGSLVAVQKGFASSKEKVGAKTLHIEPASEVLVIGRKLGIPILEMSDRFFIKIDYKCDGGSHSIIGISKDSSEVNSSEVYVSGQRCYQTFWSSSSMAGEFVLKLREGGANYEKKIEIRRETKMSSPLVDMIMSA
jgi:hypothetical protein